MPKGGKREGAGRPKGQPNKITADVREAAQKHGEQALLTLVEIMGDTEAPHAARVAASKEMLDRAYGKSTQAVEMSGPGGGPMQSVSFEAKDPQEAAQAYRDLMG